MVADQAIGYEQAKSNKTSVILKTGCFDNIDSGAIISRKRTSRKLKGNKTVLYCLAYPAEDDSSIYVVETSSFKIYNGFIFSP